MDRFTISKKDAGFHIEGFPDSVKVIKLEGAHARRLSDLALHRADLDFADACLCALTTLPDDTVVVRESLWRSAIIHFSKCFGNSRGRFQLSAKRIYKDEAPEAMRVFAYFHDLRNKHFVHDENSYAQSIPGAILNRADKKYKIEKIVCFSARAATLGQENFANLKLLIEKARGWVASEFDTLCDILTKELEQESYAKLFEKDSLNYQVPTVEEIGKNRKAP